MLGFRVQVEGVVELDLGVCARALVGVQGVVQSVEDVKAGTPLKRPEP